MRTILLFLLTQFLLVSSAAAAPADLPANGSPDTLDLFGTGSDESLQSIYNKTPILNLLQGSLTTNIKVNYPIPSSDLSLSLVYMDHRPMDRRALGNTIQRGQQSRRAYLSNHANTWLDKEDDPFRIDYLRTGKCAIRIESVKVGGPGNQRMTYQGVLDVLQGLWDILFIGRRDYESVFEVKNGSTMVGWGTVLVGNVPHMEVDSA